MQIFAMNFLKKSAFCHKCVANGAMKQMELGGNGEPDEGAGAR